MVSRRRAFTLVELLVVIAVIAVIAAILLPALSNAKENSRRGYCLGSLRQIVLGALLYADEHEERFPIQAGDGLAVQAAGGDGSNYYDLLAPYVGIKVWLCPSTREAPGRLMSYHMNGLIITSNGLCVASIVAPSDTLLLGETGQKTRFDEAYLRPDQAGGYLYDRPQQNHKGGSNAAFVDGHARWHHDMQWSSNYFKVIP